MTIRYRNNSPTKEYVAYHNMLRRVRPVNESDVRRFKGTIWDGIEVEPSFFGPRGFESFYEEVGVATSPEYLLDRVDNTKGYVKGNLKWSTPSESCMNKSSANILTAFGRTQNMMSWAKEFGIDPNLFYQRITKLGWSVEDALTSTKYSGYKRRNLE